MKSKEHKGMALILRDEIKLLSYLNSGYYISHSLPIDGSTGFELLKL